MFVKAIILSVFAVAAIAVPTESGSGSDSGSATTDVCGDGNTQSCCDTSTDDSLIAGLNCLSVPIRECEPERV